MNISRLKQIYFITTTGANLLSFGNWKPWAEYRD
jgi:hypothetical protein